MANDTLVAPLLRVELFQELTPLQLSQIARQAERIVFREGDRITEAGVEADAAFLIVGGAAEWLHNGDDSAQAEPIEIGSLIGEMAMFITYVYGATIVARGQVKCLKLSRSAMHALMLDDPALAEHMTTKIARRLTRLADDLRAIDSDFDEALPEVMSEPRNADAVAVH